MKNLTLLRIALTLFILSIVFLVAILAKNVLIPFGISIFFAYLLYPPTWALERRGMNRGVSIFLVIFLAILVFAGAALFLSLQVANVDVGLSELKEQVVTRLESAQQYVQSKTGINTSTMDNYINKGTESFFSSWQSTFGGLFSATTTTIFQIGLLPVYTFFFLFYRTKTAHFIFRIVGRKNKRKALVILREVSTVTTRYMAGLLIVVLILAILNSTGLLIIGVEHALFFGILAAILNLIPYIGTFVGGLIPILYVLFTVPHPFQTMLKVFILFACVQFLENNLITPKVVGDNIKINPLAIIMSLLLGNLIWGIAGMLIAVPTLAIIKIIMRNIDDLKPFAFLISDRGVSNYSPSLKKTWKRIIKRDK